MERGTAWTRARSCDRRSSSVPPSGTTELAALGTPQQGGPDLESLKQQWERASRKARLGREKADKHAEELIWLMPSISPDSEGAATPEADALSPPLEVENEDDEAAAEEEAEAPATKSGRGHRKKRRKQI